MFTWMSYDIGRSYIQIFCECLAMREFKQRQIIRRKERKSEEKK